MSINEIQDEIIEEFSGFDDWMDKYQLLIDLGNEQEPLDEQYKIESNLIDGCQSRVWLQADYDAAPGECPDGGFFQNGAAAGGRGAGALLLRDGGRPGKNAGADAGS